MCQVCQDRGAQTHRQTDGQTVTQTDKLKDRQTFQTCAGPDMEGSEMTGSEPFLSQQYLLYFGLQMYSLIHAGVL